MKQSNPGLGIPCAYVVWNFHNLLRLLWTNFFVEYLLTLWFPNVLLAKKSDSYIAQVAVMNSMFVLVGWWKGCRITSPEQGYGNKGKWY
jgi:hypothetical protein